MKITRGFIEGGSRYPFDFTHCSTKIGWAQVDTQSDASYYGNWANPTELKTFCYCEGDTTLVECETPEEFIQQLRELEEFEVKSDRKPPKIDPGFNEELKQAFIDMGLEDMLH